MRSLTTNTAPGSAGQNGVHTPGLKWQDLADHILKENRKRALREAASAQMLEALIWAMAELDGLTSYDTPEQRAACVSQARAAIAAATGEEG